jgi:hypothetical protein
VVAAALAGLAVVLWAIRLTRGGDQERPAQAAPPDAAVAHTEVAEADQPVSDAAAPSAADAAPVRTGDRARHGTSSRGKRSGHAGTSSTGPAQPPIAGAPPNQAPGLIIVTVKTGTSYANVRIDGLDVGETPVRREIAAGDHEVVLIEPGGTKVRLRTTVHVAPGARAKVIAP